MRLDTGERLQSVIHLVMGLEVSGGEQPRAQDSPLPIVEPGRINDVADDAGLVAILGENGTQEFRRHDDFVHQAQPRVDKRPPPRQVIGSFTAVVMQHDPLPEASREENRRQRGEDKRPVRCGEDMYKVRTPKAEERR